ncbi:hypothetical protein EJ02DRAFT_455127 [Clathrospora elynae]|uniref:Uncharacterized protein n=1 Tax=Clathrospora elynae TaxID=706981 RepID=A0A6A5SNT1_9PLEO|nr:hypothetical protein EJ02DRAFT_455127 [Clathrospora elynae]
MSILSDTLRMGCPLFGPVFLPVVDNPQAIEGRHDLDDNALGNLQRHVIANRRAHGLPEIGEFEYRHCENRVSRRGSSPPG